VAIQDYLAYPLASGLICGRRLSLEQLLAPVSASKTLQSQKLESLFRRKFNWHWLPCYAGVPASGGEWVSRRLTNQPGHLGGCVRNRSALTGIVVLLVSLSVPLIIFSQQNRSATRTAPERPAPTGTSSGKPVTAGVIKLDLGDALAIIQENYIDGNKLDYNSVFKSSISGMLSVLDPHSTYMDPIEFASFKTEQRSEYFGIGATIGDLTEGGEVNTYIRATFQGAPANRAGLRFGDKIVEVDGQSMRNKTYGEVRKFLIGPRETKVKVTVQHLASGKTETFEITRDAVSQPSVSEAYIVRPGVGYIAMTGGFNTTTSEEFENALSDLHKKGMNTLILDLRGNHGGLLIQAVRVANVFLRRGQSILTQKGRIRGSSDSFTAVNETPDTTPLVVLVNGGSASAAEILAGALQDHDRALIVGETTFGKGLVQYPYQLVYDSALLLTVAKYYTPSGRLIQRDYSNGGFYDYYTKGGSAAGEKNGTPVGPESHTDTGRPVYGGGGISPDEVVKTQGFTIAQQRLLNPVFGFALELAAGRVPGFDKYAVTSPIDYDHDVQSLDFPINDSVYKAFKAFVASKPEFKITPEQLDRDRAFAQRQLRYELATAAYGSTTALQVLNGEDPQIARAVDVMPRARELALAALRAQSRTE
jgi:carboxyl-terminal processing protease